MKEQLKFKNVNLILFIIISLVLMAVGLILSITTGAKQISFLDAIRSLFINDVTNMEIQIIRDLRLPRGICALIIGCFLATSGAIVQGITANPITSPSIMGVTQGAAFAVSLSMSSNIFNTSIGYMISAYLGAAMSAVIIFILSMKRMNVNVTRMVLAGSAIGMLFSSLASIIALLTNNTKNLGFWLAGGLSGSNWEYVKIIIVVGLIIFPIIIILAPHISALSLGDDVSIGLGEKPNRIRVLSLLVMVILSGTSVAIGGNIGFVCLIIPQIARLIVGSDYRKIIFSSSALGAILLVFSDVLAKNIIAPLELPLGSITSLIGVPVLIILVRRMEK